THGRFDRRLREISMFFQGNDAVHQAMRRVAATLEKAGIRYAVIGGMAVNAHRHERTTKDVDFLLSADGLSALRRIAEASCTHPCGGTKPPTGIPLTVSHSTHRRIQS